MITIFISQGHGEKYIVIETHCDFDRYHNYYN
jgi:hypothetical protein